MMTQFRIFALMVLAFAVHAQANSLRVDNGNIEFGERYQFSHVVADVRIENPSAAAVEFELKPVHAIPGLTLSSNLAKIDAGKSATVHIDFDLAQRAGGVSLKVPIEALVDGKKESYETALHGYVRSILDEPRPKLDLGVVNENQAGKPGELKLTSEDHPELQVTRIIEKPDDLDVRIGADHATLEIKPSSFHRLGLQKASIRFGLNTPEQTQAVASIEMDLHGNVVPDQNPTDFGLQRLSTRRDIRLQLSSRDGKPFRVGKVEPEPGVHVAVTETPCLPKAIPSCHAYLLKLEDAARFGRVLGKITFELPETHQVLDEYLTGVYLSDSSKITSLNDVVQAKHSRTTSDVDLTAAIRAAASPPPPGSGPLLKWQVANEAGIYGYGIFRGTDEKGPFERANPVLLKAGNAGDGVTADYQWRDTNAKPGTVYWYYISIFYSDGHIQKLTGPQKFEVK